MCSPNYFHFLSMNFMLSLVCGVVTHVSTVINSPTASCSDKWLLRRLVATEWLLQAASFSDNYTPPSDGFLPFFPSPPFFSPNKCFHCTPIVDWTNEQRKRIIFLLLLIFEDTGRGIKPYDFRQKMDILIIFQFLLTPCELLYIIALQKIHRQSLV